MKNNALLGGGRYFFMEINMIDRSIINEIMYSKSIATTSFLGDDGITARLLPLFRSYLFAGFLRQKYHTTYFILFQPLSTVN